MPTTPSILGQSQHECLEHPDGFAYRHLGPSHDELEAMLKSLGYADLDALADAAVPPSIRMKKALALGEPMSEYDMLSTLRELADKNVIRKSYIGMGYYDTITPPVILRNVLENPGWYTQYTPYQAEIAQGRLEALLNFQTLICDLTGLDMANSSLLDEGTAAAEAMTLCHAVNRKVKDARFFVSARCHPQTLAVMKTRAEAVGIELVVGDEAGFDFKQPVCGALVQIPDTHGRVWDPKSFIERAHTAGALVVVASDLMALTLLTPPGDAGADVVIGSAQRLGVPMGYGGPHAAFIATRDTYKRQLPGRIVGITKTVDGKRALRLALQTREQHIRREKATSNICTAQVLLAIMASMYAVYHGPDGLKKIARRIRFHALLLADGLRRLGYDLGDAVFFDTVRVPTEGSSRDDVLAAADRAGINLRRDLEDSLGVAIDETTAIDDVELLLTVFAEGKLKDFSANDLIADVNEALPAELARTSEYLTNPVFHSYHSETEMLRYIHRLQAKDLSLTTSMIPLGSCTMKLNATTEMIPVTWPEFGRMHPFAPLDQAQGYQALFEALEAQLAEITGFHAYSLQPNAGSQGEYSGMLVIRAYHASRGEGHRHVCLIPSSAHGTNPASAVMAGMKVVVTKCDDQGNIDLADLAAKAEKHADNLAAIMVTYPSTHGVFESTIREVCKIVHDHGGQVYLDGANLNAQMGLARPGDYGADVCHLNLHKTFCIPHGGGGPGMGPIGVAEHLAPFLPGHPLVACGGEQAMGPVAAAPWGSPSILPISYAFIAMLGAEGIKRASQVAILNANYMAKRLESHYDILYRGPDGLVAHEFILDMRPLKQSADVEVEDVAKRLMDYGFHAPTISWPVAGTMMIEPTESESKEECDRLCDALIAIHDEAKEVADGAWPRDDNPLKNAPHTAEEIAVDAWPHPYTREEAVFPSAWSRSHKFWPPVKRADNVYGDRNLICSCPPLEAYDA